MIGVIIVASNKLAAVSISDNIQRELIAEFGGYDYVFRLNNPANEDITLPDIKIGVVAKTRETNEKLRIKEYPLRILFLNKLSFYVKNYGDGLKWLS